MQFPVLSLFDSNAAHLSGKLPAKQERKYTITKSPQSYKEGEEEEEEGGRKAATSPVSIA